MKRIAWLRAALAVLCLVVTVVGAAAQPPPLFYAVLSDTQKGDDNPFDDFRWAVEQVNDLQPQFVLFPGDLTDSGTVNQYKHWTAVRRDLRVPLYACPGNHDGVPGATDYARRFAQFVGCPTYYARQLGGWKLLVLDGVCFKEGKLQHEGSIPPEELEWLRSELFRLSPQQPILVLCHFPLLPQWSQVSNAAELLACFEGKYLAYTLTGHWHSNAHARDDQGRLHLVTSSLSFAGPPDGIGYRLLSTVGPDLYTAWVGRKVEEPLTLLGETSGAGPLTVSAPRNAPVLALRVEYQGGPLRVRLSGPWGIEWVGVLPAAPERAQALVPLRGPWRERLSGEGDLRLSVEPLATTRVARLALYTSPLAWQYYRLPSPPPSPR